MDASNGAEAQGKQLQAAQAEVAKLQGEVVLFRIYRECVKQENGLSGEARLFSNAQLLLTNKLARDGQATHAQVAEAKDKKVRALEKENQELRIRLLDDARVAELRGAKAAETSATAPEPAAEHLDGAEEPRAAVAGGDGEAHA